MEIYFDNSATTKPYEEVIDAVAIGMREYYGNPSSLHNLGIKCEKRLNEAREFFAKTINCSKEEILFTSGATEGNNLIFNGIVKPGHHVITTAFEHHSVLKTVEALKEKGVKVTVLEVDEWGQISIEDLKEAICKDTVLVSIMHVNNEMGAIANLEEIGAAIKATSSRAKFHVDAVQGYGKLRLDVKKMNIDLLSVTAHKFHGPKGVGFTYIKKGIGINAMLTGGSQERGLRAGTQNLPGIIGMEKAAELVTENMKYNYEKVRALKAYFINRLEEIDNIRVNSPNDKYFSPYILNVSFVGVRAEVLLHLLEEKGIYVSTGSACTSKTSIVNGSYVMKSLKLQDKEIESAIRFSFSKENTEEEIDIVIETLKSSLKFLRIMRKGKK